MISTFFQLLGGVFGLAISGAIFDNLLQKTLLGYGDDIPADTIRMVKKSLEVMSQLDEKLHKKVLHSFLVAIHWTFILPLVGMVLTGISLALFEWIRKRRENTRRENTLEITSSLSTNL
jgi:hypothetical protein